MDVALVLLFAAFLLLLLNVAAACGVAALHGCLRGRALAGSDPAATVAGAAAVCSPEPGTGLRPGSPLGSGSGSGGRIDDLYALRIRARDLLPARLRDQRLIAVPRQSTWLRATRECDRSSGGMRIVAGSAP
ncbi:hypothetical protein ACIBL3_35085 [Kribbella sp. NPDC050124]|uniref:hypothetical protein n=1 Tax=Kribbella sp. NPDC050124 TaxID=3364114 RepID=UPI0037967BEE